MAVTYSTIAKVRQRATDYSANPPDAAITAMILNAESVVDVVMRKRARGTNPDFTFDTNKHGIIEMATTDLAASLMVASDPSLAATNSEAALMIDIFWASSARSLKMLADERIVKFLEGL